MRGGSVATDLLSEIFICHDGDDDGWQFHHDGEGSMENAMLVSLKNIVDLGPSVLEDSKLAAWLGRNPTCQRRQGHGCHS
ncbi:MAG: hypothetical protein ACJAVK_000917 [Akkermansiaceae bacterium]|jgi:hypothetical protein